MIRTQVSLTDDQMRRARVEARRRGVSLAELVRQGLERVLDDDGQRELRERAKKAVGDFRSGHTDTSEDHDAVLAESPRW